MSIAPSLRSLLERNDGKVRLLEAHDQNTVELIRQTVGNSGQKFHGVWMSGLTQTTALGIPDTELVSPFERSLVLPALDRESVFPNFRQLGAAYDADSGGQLEDIPALVTSLANKGITMIIVEDKSVDEPGSKANSLGGSSNTQKQASVDEFANVIRQFKASSADRDIMTTARIESFTTKPSGKDAAEDKILTRAALNDALIRAQAYTEAGADAILIHSKSKSADEVLSFISRFRSRDQITPLVVVPTSYSETTEEELYAAGVNVVIYANHLMRAKIQAVVDLENRTQAASKARLHEHRDLEACVEARNFGCLLQKLSHRDFGQNARRYAYIAERYATENMGAVVEQLLNGRKASAADERMISVKDLLKINARQITSTADLRPVEKTQKRTKDEFQARL